MYFTSFFLLHQTAPLFNTSQRASEATSSSSTENIRDELHRLFPSVRRSASNVTPATSATVVVERLTKRRKKSSGKSKPFIKEVMLVKRPTDVRTLTGYRKAEAYDKGLF